MRRLILPLTVALAAITGLSGCASMPMGTLLAGAAGRGPDARPKPDAETKQGAKKGAGIGCALGAAIGFAKGGLGNAAKGCAAGAAAGALVGGARAYRQQLADARVVADEATAMGIDASVSTKTVPAKGNLGKTEQVEALDALTLTLDAKLVAKRDAGVQQLLEKAARLAEASELPTTLRVEGPETVWMGQELRRHLAIDTDVVVEEAWAQSPALVLSPVPVVAS